MSNVGLFLVVLTLFAVEGLAKPSIDQVFNWPRVPNQGRPSTSSGGQSECRKDILLVVDTSFSIGESSFNDDVKPFLKKLINDPTLNVGRDGTQIAMIIFSSKEKTKILFNFGEKLDKETLVDYIDGMDWDKVKGGRTRTDFALELANNVVFTKQSPENNRADIGDVVIMITDGRPRGAADTKQKAIDSAQNLKDKDVLVIAAGVGPKRKNFLETLQQMATSIKYTVEADFNEMDKILGRLVASSCTKPGQCTCHAVQSTPTYVKPGNSKASVSWPKPKYECWSGRAAEEERFIVNPAVTSPHKFSVGKHIITYTFKLKGGVDVVCPVSLEVKGELCRGIAFSSETQVCCCGTIHVKQSNPPHDCCGPDYYDMSKERCCSNANRVSNNDSCPR